MESLLSSASSLLEQNRFGEAAALLQRESQQRCDYRVDLLLAASLEGNNDLLDAEHILRKASSVWPSNCSVAASLARYALQAGNPDAASGVVSRCVPDSVTSQRELRLIALVYLDSGQLERGRRIAAIAWRRDPSEENLLFLTNFLQLEGRYMDAIALLKPQRHTYEDSPGFLITLAESESDAKLYPAAQGDLQHALSLDPRSYPAHYVLGHLLVATGHPAEAIEQYEQAIQISPQQPRTYYQLGRVLEQQNRTAEASRYFENAVSVDSHYAPAWSEIGKLEFRQQQYRSAVDDLNRAIRCNPALQDPYYLLVQAYARLGKKDKSRSVMAQWQAYKKAHPLKPAGADLADPGTTTAADSSSGAADSPQ